MYKQIMNCIMNKLKMTDPEDLLPKNILLLGLDPENLINTSPNRRQVWLANLDSALAAAGNKTKLLMMMTKTRNPSASVHLLMKLAVYYK